VTITVHCSRKGIRMAVYQAGELMLVIDVPPWPARVI